VNRLKRLSRAVGAAAVVALAGCGALPGSEPERPGTDPKEPLGTAGSASAPTYPGDVAEICSDSTIMVVGRS
jgi:hypothetical protein